MCGVRAAALIYYPVATAITGRTLSPANSNAARAGCVPRPVDNAEEPQRFIWSRALRPLLRLAPRRLPRHPLAAMARRGRPGQALRAVYASAEPA